MGVPLVVIHFRLGFSFITIHFGVPPFMEPPICIYIYIIEWEQVWGIY